MHQRPRDDGPAGGPKKKTEVEGINEDLSSLLLRQVVQFLTNAGLPNRTVAANLRNLAQAVQVGRSIPRGHSRDYELMMEIPRIVHDWVRSPEYTGRDGEPKALALRGTRGLATLIKRHFPLQPTSLVLEYMISRGAIRRRADGKYALLRRQVIYRRRASRDFIEWTAALAGRYLDTAFGNWQHGDPSSRQLDRVARVFDLPEKEVAHFREFTKSRAESWLEEIDNWLEDHSAPSGRQRRVEAGVHVYGYVAPVRRVRQRD